MRNALWAFLSFGSIGLMNTSAFAQEPASETEGTADGDGGGKFGLHVQLGILSPVGLGGGYLSYSPIPQLTLMAGGGFVWGNHWRASLGVRANLPWRRTRLAMARVGFEVWGAMGSWTELGSADGGELGRWDLMPMGYFHLTSEWHLDDANGGEGGLRLRLFAGPATNFGFAPNNGAACENCSGPTIALSAGASLGFVI